ncbi:hypothetical protein [Tropicimonas sediminicola]|uniref:DUF5681 domain-containing protein n=1 Tax=Tropicimonas sediminicola TaxID=1031541 RepID=A0A239FL74_9RHOB|nr:hypothetical protein [Tropicimonas sediminicola]SNS57003.1 hypothetical protein SAMN05421757_102702 [Tropicimonas sediminicola]
MTWVKGQSGNPSGRPRMDPQVREAIRQNGVAGVERMRELLDDDTAWGPDGWLDPKVQVQLAETAIVRAFGSHGLANDEHGPTGMELGQLMRSVYETMREDGVLPELLNAEKATDAN